MSDLQRACRLIRQQEHEEARDILNRLLNECLIENSKGQDELLYLLGLSELEQGHYALAKTLFEASLSVNPTNSAVYNNIGVCLDKLGHPIMARDLFQSAINLKDDGLYYSNLASVYVGHGEPDRVITLSKKAIELKKEIKRSHWNIALASLERGDYERGFRLYEYGFDTQVKKLKLRHYPNIPLWQGEKNKTIVAYGDQGIGDEIMYASLLRDVMKDCNVIIECHPRLVNLLKNTFPNHCVYGTRKGQADWLDKHSIDAAISFCLLPKFYRKKPSDFPREPYLKANTRLVNHYANRLSKLEKPLKIGISWSGGILETGKKYRHIPLEELKPLFDLDADFISLQYTPEASKEIKEFSLKTGIRIHHWQGTINNYDRTAALLSNLDVVISVPQSVVHLAGALGVRTLQLCPVYSMWQCGPYGENPPWYKSVTNIWQESPDDWHPVIERVKHLLRGGYEATSNI